MLNSTLYKYLMVFYSSSTDFCLRMSYRQRRKWCFSVKLLCVCFVCVTLCKSIYFLLFCVTQSILLKTIRIPSHRSSIACITLIFYVLYSFFCEIPKAPTTATRSHNIYYYYRVAVYNVLSSCIYYYNIISIVFCQTHYHSVMWQWVCGIITQNFLTFQCTSALYWIFGCFCVMFSFCYFSMKAQYVHEKYEVVKTQQTKNKSVNETQKDFFTLYCYYTGTSEKC